VAESAWELYLGPTARETFDQASEAEREELSRLFRLIELDPWVEGQVKVRADLPPGTVVIYRHANWRIAYVGPDQGRIRVISVRRFLGPGRGEPFDL